VALGGSRGVDTRPRASPRRARRRHRRPTAAWTAQQLHEAFPWVETPRYLFRDPDTAFAEWATAATAIGFNDVMTAAHSPWRNAYAKRLIGSIRRECLDHIIVANECSLRRVLHAYVDYYLKSRTDI
jgi:putative transposase